MAREIKKIIEKWFKELSYGTLVGVTGNDVASWKVVEQSDKNELIRRVEEWLNK